MVVEDGAVYLGTSLFDRVGMAKTTLPKIEFNKETFTGYGIMGSIKKGAKGDVKEMTCSLEFMNMTQEHFDALDPYGKYITIRGSVQKGATTQAVKAVIFAEADSYDPGNLEKGKKMDTKLEVSTTYYYLEIDGEPQIEIDQINDVFKIKGVEKRLKVKQDVGLL